MKIAFCTTCRGRVQHLKLTLPQNLLDNPEALFIVVDYGSPDDLLSFLSSIENERLIVYSLKSDCFRMAHAKNVAHRIAIRAGADVLVNLDADNYTGKG